MPPLVTPLRPRDLVTGPLEDENMLDEWTIFESSIDNRFGGNGLSTAFAFVRRNDDARLAILDSVTKRLGREPRKDNGVNSPDTSASQERSYSMPSHRKVNRDSISLLDAETLENVCDATDLAQEFSVRDFPTLTRLISLVNDCGLRSRDY
jgi:hypothetical protein